MTGASRGIGRALAVELASRGATVGLAARSVSDLEALAAELPGSHHVLVCDVALRESIQAAVEDFIAAAGGLDLLIVNAGVAHYEPLATQDIDKIELMTEVNWLGTVYTVKAALPHMLEHGSGHIVVMSSGAGLRSFPEAAAYSATKAAQRMFAEAIRHELAGSGVSVTAVYPGEIATSLHDHQPERTMPDWYRGEDAAPARGARRPRHPRGRARSPRPLLESAGQGDGPAARHLPPARRPRAAPAARQERGAAPRLTQPVAAATGATQARSRPSAFAR